MTGLIVLRTLSSWKDHLENHLVYELQCQNLAFFSIIFELLRDSMGEWGAMERYASIFDQNTS